MAKLLKYSCVVLGSALSTLIIRSLIKFRWLWLITGDVGKIDPEEYLIIADRSKDLVKSGGEWISSVDLENHIVGVDGVAQACVVAQPHPKWDERPVALVILEAGKEVAEQTILQLFCETAFAKWQLPDEILFVDNIPLASTGKMDKDRARRFRVQGLPATFSAREATG